MASNQYKNKIVFDGNTLIDLSFDTVTPSVLAQGYTAHDQSGAPITGTLSFVTYHTSSSVPSSNDGSDGDIWLVTS